MAKKTQAEVADEAASKEFEIPESLPKAVDLYFTLRSKRLALEKKANETAEHESALRTHLIRTIPKSDMTGVAGKKARCSVTTKKVHQVSDWPTFYKMIRRNNAFELLGRRINEKAIKERIDSGKKVAGVKDVDVVVLHLSAIK